MYYTGIDLHRKTSFITTIDSNGKMVRKANLSNDEKHILDYFERLEDKTRIIIESLCAFHPENTISSE